MKNPPHYTLLSRLFLHHEGETFLTPERMALLKSITTKGSISAAAKHIDKSYKWAWDSIEQMNTHAKRALVEKSSGGKGGGGAKVTIFALELIHYYDDLARIHQSKILQYQEQFEQAFEVGSFSNAIASTLHGSIKSIKRTAQDCDLSIDYAATTLRAKCSSALALHEGQNVTFMVESNQIIIAKEAVSISAQNCLVGTITEIKEVAKKVYLILALSSNESLSVLITTDALEQLKLSLGERCFAYFKTYNITILGETL